MAEGGAGTLEELERYKNLYERANDELMAANAEIAKLRNELLQSSRFDELNFRVQKADVARQSESAVGTGKAEGQVESTESEANEGQHARRLDFSDFIRRDLLLEALQYLNRSDLCSLAGVSRHFYRYSESPLVRPLKPIPHFVVHLSDGIVIIAGRKRLECPIPNGPNGKTI